MGDVDCRVVHVAVHGVDPAVLGGGGGGAVLPAGALHPLVAVPGQRVQGRGDLDLVAAANCGKKLTE